MFPVPRFAHPHSAVFHRTTAALFLLLLPIAWLCAPRRKLCHCTNKILTAVSPIIGR